MTPDAQVLSMQRHEVAGIALGAIFLFVGLSALAVAALRHRLNVRLLLWFGLFSGLYGVRMLAQFPAAFDLLPQSLWPLRRHVIALVTNVIILPALFFWLELARGNLRRFIHAAIVAAAIIAVCATSTQFIGRSSEPFMEANYILDICVSLVVGIIFAAPPLSRRLLTERSGVLATGTLVLAAVALLTNLEMFLPLPGVGSFEPIAFAIFVFSLGYVSAQRIFTNERRLISIENELDIAREIQKSILPVSVPESGQLHIAASYLPMTSVAGDFYEFIHLDEDHAGFLVADVSGHGVPAALIASMVKVAMHSVSAHAAAPAEVMSGLNQILSHQLRGQFVTAAYLYIDLETRRALYSAAGHPPLLYWSAADKELQKIESNGLLFGVLKETEYPVCDLKLNLGDRFLLYTDGLIEPENSSGEAFGDHQLSNLISSHPLLPAADLSALILEEFGNWIPRLTTQQDDVTLIVIDVPFRLRSPGQ